MKDAQRPQHPTWNWEECLKDTRMCEAVFSVANNSYPDLLRKVRDNISRAMSGWLEQNGIRAVVSWSEEDDCFVGRLIGVPREFEQFHGRSPSEVQSAFAEMVKRYIWPSASVSNVSDPMDTPCSAENKDGTVIEAAKVKQRKRSSKKRASKS